MAYSLTTLARRAGKRRDITLRPIIPTQAQATDLATIYAPAWRIWADSVDRILAGYDPKPLPAADALTLDTADQVQAAINAVASEFLTVLVARITPALRRWTVTAELRHRSRWSAAVKAGTDLDISMLLSAQEVSETLEVFMARNVALCRNISDQAQGRIADAVFRGYQERRPVREVAAEIREATGMGRTRAVAVAADQSSKLSGALDTERMAEAGLDFAKWRHSAKRFPRQDHLARDGKIYNIRTGKERDGDGSVPADDRPGMRPWCGCRFQAWIPLLQEIEGEES